MHFAAAVKVSLGYLSALFTALLFTSFRLVASCLICS